VVTSPISTFIASHNNLMSILLHLYYDTVLNIYQLLYLLNVYNHIPVLQNY
jgi:hypothetical protein